MYSTGLQDGRQAHHSGQRLQFLRQLPLVQIDICEITLQAKFLIIYQHIQAGLLSKEKAIPNHPLSDLSWSDIAWGHVSLKGLSLSPQKSAAVAREQLAMLILKHFVTVMKPGLSTTSVQTQAPTWLKNTRHFLSKRGRVPSGEGGKENCLHFQGKQRLLSLWVISIQLVSCGKTTFLRLGGAVQHHASLTFVQGQQYSKNCPMHYPFSYL